MAAERFPSIKNRVFRSSKAGIPPMSVLNDTRHQKYKSWSDVQLNQACEAVKKGVSLRQAAEEYNIPKSTLYDHVSGRILPGSKSGHRYLTDDEEHDLAAFLIGCSKVGFPHTRKDVLSLVQRIVDDKGKGEQRTVTHGWWEAFKKRHPEIVLRTAEPLAQARAKCCSKEVLENYFDLLEKTLTDNDLLNKPSQIFNCDETGMPLDPKAPKVVAERGVKHPRSITTGDKAQITVLACCNAAGYVIPPFVIYDRKSLKAEMYDGEVPGSMYGLSDSGWMTSELFDLWFLHHFLPHAPSARPLLLLLDGHSSHYNPVVIKKAAEENVILFCLPPHSSHLSQPLDKGPFGPLKSSWKEVCKQFLMRNPGKFVTRFTFSKLFHQAWSSAMNMQNIVSGFKCTGIYPLCRDVLIPPEEHQDNHPTTATTVCKFIPMLSPMKRVSVAQVLSKLPTVPEFSEEEVSLFERRFKEGFDLETDERYNLWKKNINHPKSEDHNHPCSIDPIDLSPSLSNLSLSTEEPAAPKESASIPQQDVYIPSEGASLPRMVQGIEFDPSTYNGNFSQFQAKPFPGQFPGYGSEYPSGDMPHYVMPWSYYMPPQHLPPPDPYGSMTHMSYPSTQPPIPPSQLPRNSIVDKLLKEGPPIKLPEIPPKSCGKVLTSEENRKMLEEKAKLKNEKELKKQERALARETKKVAREAKGKENIGEKRGRKNSNKNSKTIESTGNNKDKNPGRKANTDVDDQWCICKGKETEEMVCCDGENCEIGWWHFACAGLDSAPEEELWFCDYCKIK